jgi:uncharacterized protein YecT (DUF1311 family)
MKMSNARRILTAAWLTVASTASVLAADKIQETPLFRSCMDAVDLGAFKNSQWHACYMAELQRQDKVLNGEYKSLQERLSPELKEPLTKAQRAWLAFRDSWCRYEAELPNAPGGDVNRAACMVEQTIAQSNRLRESF